MPKCSWLWLVPTRDEKRRHSNREDSGQVRPGLVTNRNQSQLKPVWPARARQVDYRFVCLPVPRGSHLGLNSCDSRHAFRASRKLFAAFDWLWRYKLWWSIIALRLSWRISCFHCGKMLFFFKVLGFWRSAELLPHEISRMAIIYKTYFLPLSSRNSWRFPWGTIHPTLHLNSWNYF